MTKFSKKALSATMLLVCLLGFTKAKASHIAAADMWVTYIGAGQDGCTGTTEYKYEVNIEIYSACEIGSLNSVGPITLEYWSTFVNGGAHSTVNIPAPANPIIVNDLCPQFVTQNACLIPANQAFDAYRKWVYQAIVILPSPQTDWKFAVNVPPARNGAINNIQPNTSYMECMLNNVIKYNNSTAKFDSNPIPYICTNTDYIYQNKIIEPNTNDRIEVVYQTAYATPTVQETYKPGFDIVNPVGSTTGFVVDNTTGSAYFNIPNQGKYVLGFRANSYDVATGTLSSYVYRDVQVKVFPCTAPPPLIDSIPQSPKNCTIVDNCFTNRGAFIYACPGSDISFDISAVPHPNNPGNLVYMVANNLNPLKPMVGSTFTVANDGTNKPVATFRWTPTINDYGEWILSVDAADSTCSNNQPIVLRTARTYLIRVVKGLDAGGDREVCELNGKPQQLAVKGTDCLEVTWTALDGGPALGLNKANIINPIDTLIKPVVDHGFIVFTNQLAGTCKARDTVEIKIDRGNSVKTYPENPVILCRPDYLQMDAVIAGKTPLSNLACGLANPIKCDVPDELTIKGSLAYGDNVSYDTLGTTTPTFPNYKTKSTKMQYLISRDDLWASGFRAATINSLAFEVVKNISDNHEYENFTIGVKCSATVDQLSKEKGFETGFTPVYVSTAPIKFPVGWNEFKFDAPYSWDTTQNLIFEICYDNPTEIDLCVDPGGTAPVLRFVLADYVSSLSLSALQTAPAVCNAVKNTNIKPTQSRPLFKFKFCEAKTVPFKYTWFPGTLLSDSTIAQPLAYVPKSITYAFESFGRNGCVIRDSVKIYVPDNTYSITPADTAICLGETAPLRVKGGFTYKWYTYKDGEYTLLTDRSTCWECPDPILTPQATTIYKIVVYDSVWCTDTLTARVEVMPLPDVRILNRDTIVKYGQGLQLLVGGARTYNWMQPGSLSNTTISNPIARPTEATDYVVGGIGRNGCRAFDTVKVAVDYRDNLFIPSAFSPNGDGKNDVFKITNLSFQRVMEFRVFNRWGQEVFYSNDNTHGWDGNWKGVPQDLGSYQYLIRLGYPDGLVETYKGEVTLVR